MPDKEIILAIDSSSSPLLVALSARAKTFYARSFALKQEDYLFKLIRKLLAKAGGKFNEIKTVFFIKGPGRFTGIRIGITLASMLKELSGASAASATVFDAVECRILKSSQFKKWKKQNPAGRLAVVIHAFRGEYFLGFEGVQKWLSFEELNSFLDAVREPLFIAGWGRDKRPLSEVLPAKFSYAAGGVNFISPQTLIEMSCVARYGEGDVFEPLYLKPARFEMEQSS
jgi:tRNA threonylcarbamoyl adenosine modification protein YeaZ